MGETVNANKTHVINIYFLFNVYTKLRKQYRTYDIYIYNIHTFLLIFRFFLRFSIYVLTLN